MKYALIEIGIVTRVQPNAEAGLIEVDDSVVCGMITSDNVTFSNPPKTDKELQDAMIAEGEVVVVSHIQEPIDDYNKANGVSFAHAHTCANYKDEIGYMHQPFCLQVWQFNVAVWEAARLIQVDVLMGTIPPPTEDEFKAMLPVFGA